MSARATTAGRRRHVYLNDREDEGLERLADELGTSYSYVMRVALRRLLGMPVPAFGRFETDPAVAAAVRDRRVAEGSR